MGSGNPVDEVIDAHFD